MDIKRIITDILAYVLAIGTAVAVAVEALPDNSQWFVVVGVAAFAILSWFMGRNGDGTSKERITKH